MSTNKGTKVFEKTSWGKKQVKTEFDLDIIKSNQASVDIAKLLTEKSLKDVGFNATCVSKIVEHASNIQSTYGHSGYIFMLQSVWNAHGAPLEYNGADGEFQYIKRFFNRMKKESIEGTVIGKKQIIQAAYTHALDLLDHI